jgi:D-alanyl-D-alanine carboxypeptidase
MRHLYKLPLIALIAISTQSYGQSFSPKRLDSLFNALNNSNQAMGAVCITQNGNVLYSKAFGFYKGAGKAQQRANTLTQYRIGSVTKVFTATIILQLAQHRLLDLNTHINKYFPEIPNADKISIDMLLGHRSGLHDFTTDTDYPKYSLQATSITPMLKRIAAYRPDFKPGEKTFYSSTNYLLLGYIIEKVTGRSYDSNLQQRIVKAAGLKHTRFAIGSGQANDALSYNFNGRAWVPVTLSHLSVPGGAGGIVSTPQDMATFIRALFKLKLIGQNYLTAMTPLSGSLGRGLVQVPVADQLAFGHFGIIDGFKSTLLYLPQADVALAVCFNSANTDDNAVVEKMLTITLQQLSHTVTLPAAQLAKYQGVYASKQLPLKITIKSTGGHLTLQADKREPLILETLNATTFRFAKGDMLLNFTPLPGNNVNHFTLKQGGNVYEFFK